MSNFNTKYTMCENRCLLFDFDNTLVNSDSRRDSDGRWLSGFPDEAIQDYKLYDGWKDVLDWAQKNNVKTAIISTTPADHIQKTLDHFGIQVDKIEGNVKKNSGRILTSVIDVFGCTTENALYVGDNRKDADIARMAGVHFAAAVWDSWHEERLKRRNCYAIDKRKDIISLFDNLDKALVPIKVDNRTDPAASMPKARQSASAGFAQLVKSFLSGLSAKELKGQTKIEPNDPPRSNDEDRTYGILGAIIGDIAGSSHSSTRTRCNSVKALFGAQASITDDTVLTVAVADALLNDKTYADTIWEWGHNYSYAEYGGGFRAWMKGDRTTQGTSSGNGSAMRVSPVGFYAKSLEEALELAEQSSIPTHNSQDAIKGAQSIAASIFLARSGKSKSEIKQYVESTFGYDLNLTKEEIQSFVCRLSGGEKALAKYCAPIAISSVLSGVYYEDVIKTAITYLGYSDTIACMAGGIAAAYYGVPKSIAEAAVKYLDDDILGIVNKFDKTSFESGHITPKNPQQWKDNIVVVYGTNIDGKHNEDGGAYTHESRFNHYPRKGYPIRTVGYDFETQTKEDIANFVKYVEGNKEETFLIMRVGIDKANIPVAQIAPLFKSLFGRSNVYFPLQYIEFFQNEGNC